MPFLDLPTHRLHYRLDGAEDVTSNRAWLVFCNSLGTDLHMWDDQVRELTDTFRILRYDRRGHGLSSAARPPYMLEDLGRDVIALLDALKIARAHFCGLSIGGLTGQWLAIHAGSRFEKIVLCATASKIGTKEGWTARIKDVAANGLGSMASATEERWFTSEFRSARPDGVARVLDSFSKTSKDGYIGCCGALSEADLTQQLASIGNPVLAVAGAHDPVCPPVDLKSIAQTVCNGRHITLPGRHIVNMEDPQAFNAAVHEFLHG